MTDPRNCGRCGNVCEWGVCEEGVCFEPCKTLQSEPNHCVFTKGLTEEFPCYVDDEYGSTGGSTCSSDDDCQTDCPDHYDCVCSQLWASKKDGVGYKSKPATCLGINKAVAGKCCYPEAEQRDGNDSYWYCVIDEDGVEHQDASGLTVVTDASSNDLTCTTTADCLQDDECQGLTATQFCVCAQAVNPGEGEVDGHIEELSPKLCYLGDTAS